MPKIWKPDLYFYNHKFVQLMENLQSAQILGFHKGNGTFKWWIFIRVQINCPMNFASYPMDSQSCPLLLGSTAGEAPKNNFKFIHQFCIDYSVIHVGDINSIIFTPIYGDTLGLNSINHAQKLNQYDMEVRNISKKDRIFNSTTTGRDYFRVGFVMYLERRFAPFLITWYW